METKAAEIGKKGVEFSELRETVAFLSIFLNLE